MKRLLALCCLVLSSAAWAQESEARADASESSTGTIGLEISFKAGGHFPQLMNPLGTSFDGILKLGYSPLENKQIQFFTELGYSQPSFTFTDTDPRLGEEGGDFTSTLTLRDLNTSLGAAYFFVPLESFLVPYAGAGLKAHFLRFEVEAAGGSEFGRHEETATRFGGMVFGGAGLHLGPGLLLGELRVGYAPVEEVVSGVSNIGHLSVMLGYGLLL